MDAKFWQLELQMLEIAGGIILAVMFFAFLPEILVLGGFAIALGLSIAALVLLYLAAHEYPAIAAVIGQAFGIAVVSWIAWCSVVDSEWIKRFPKIQVLIDRRAKPVPTPIYPEREPLEVELYEERREIRPAVRNVLGFKLPNK